MHKDYSIWLEMHHLVQAASHALPILRYLSDVEEGGETAFPENSVWFDTEMGARADSTFSDCAKVCYSIIN